MALTKTTNYVKFVRGTSAAWGKLAQKDPETLYFIYDKTSNDPGRLYLGDKLIAGDVSSVGDINDLASIALKESGLSEGDILIVDENGKLVNESFAGLVGGLVKTMTGASSESAGLGGLVPTPDAKDDVMFLRGDGTWANPTADIDATLKTLLGEGETTGSLESMVNDKVSSAVADIVDGAPEAYDTLKEIASWIEGHKEATDVALLSSKVASLEDLLNGNEESGTTGLVDVIETISGDVDNLSDELDGLKALIGEKDDSVIDATLTLFERVKNVEDKNSDLNDAINAVSNKLLWYELSE